MNNFPCCEKCKAPNPIVGFVCFNPNCTCHSNSPDKMTSANNDSGRPIHVPSVFIPSQENPQPSEKNYRETKATEYKPNRALNWLEPLEKQETDLSQRSWQEVNRQPSEAWEEEFDSMNFTPFNKASGSRHLDEDKIKSFIREQIAEAKEEGRIGGHRRYNEGYQHGAEDGRMEVHSKDGAAWDAGLAQGRKEGRRNTLEFGILRKKAGRTAALKECLEVIEGMKKDVPQNWKDKDLKWGTIPAPVMAWVEHNFALSDLKQQITSLLKNK